MCGIAGFVGHQNPERAQHTGDAMQAAILYRGRDAQAKWTDGHYAHLFHARLSVIAVTDGAQPMHDREGRFTIVFNGEIYNYIELRMLLTARGARFRTESDTEVILEGFKLFGAAICKQLNGMFAFAIWDSRDRHLFIARDRVGKKPLYWCSIAGTFYFASTMDAFRGTPGWRDDISDASIALYSVLGGFPGESTVWRQARSLPAACHAWVEYGQCGPRIEKYWRVDYSEKTESSLDTLLEEYEAVLTEAIRIRLRSDVPLALTFSGGTDSGTIAAICEKKLGTNLPCYTIDYDTADDPSQEVDIARRTARHLGLDWRYIQFDYKENLLADLPRCYAPFDQPCQQLALVYSTRLYEEIKSHATVVLSGNGADELFTGYIGDELTRSADVNRSLSSKFRFLPAFARSFSEAIGASQSLVSQHREALICELRRLSLSDSVRDEAVEVVDKLCSEFRKSKIDTSLDLMMEAKLAYAASDSNYRLADISGLSAQVEVRSPFLDHRLVEFAARLPHHFKVGDHTSPNKNKFLPRLYYEKHVSSDIAWSRKKGMGYNLNWHKSIVSDPNYRSAFAESYRAIESAGVDSSSYVKGWKRYIADLESGHESSNSAEWMMNGFMFGAWLARKPATASEVSISPQRLPQDGAFLTPENSDSRPI